MKKICWFIVNCILLIGLATAFYFASEFKKENGVSKQLDNSYVLGFWDRFIYHYHIDYAKYNQDGITIKAWALKDGTSSLDLKCSFALKEYKTDEIYRIYTYRETRKDVSDIFLNTIIDEEGNPVVDKENRETLYDYSGIYSYTPGDVNLPLDGEYYWIYLVFDEDDGTHLYPTNQLLRRIRTE